MSEPTVLGVYRIVGKLGDGAMGLVYEGRHDVLGRRVAIKMLRPELAKDPQLARRFLNEARAANAISHENIVNVYDVGENPEDGVPYLVMELLEGETLAERLTRGPMTVRETTALFVPLLRALAAAHGRGVVHRDLKPANVFLAKRSDGPPLPKLLDFGVAKLSAELSEKMTKTGTVIGTPVYMSPEQIGGKAAEPRSDLFTLGVMMWEALMGHPPFRGATMGELAMKILQEDPPATGTELDPIIGRAMQKSVDKRWPTATAMQEALVAAVAGGPRLSGSMTAVGRNLTPIWVGAGIVAVGVGVAVTVAMTRKTPPPAVVVAPPPPERPPTPPPVDLGLGAAETSLVDALQSGDLAEAGDALAALDLAATGRTARLLYAALKGPPELRRQAAHVLERLDVPEAAPRVRAVLDASGDRLRVELAAVLAELGDRDVTAMLRRGLEEPGTRLLAALGLVALGDAERARPVLVEIFTSSPPGRLEWQRAAGALAALGDAAARAALIEELAQPDTARAVAAATHLGQAGVDEGKAYLRRVVADAEFTRRGEAALALARLGDRDALPYVAVGLASRNPEERRLAAAVAAQLGDASQAVALARMAREEPDRRTRLTAAAALLSVSGGS